MKEAISIDKSSLQIRLLILIGVVVILLIFGTFFYHLVEGWSYIDAFYFSSISLSTRGYGELHPTSVGSKLFTVFYLFLGVAFILYMLSSFISYFLQYQEPKVRKKVNSLMNIFVPPKKERWVVVKAHRQRDSELELPAEIKLKR